MLSCRSFWRAIESRELFDTSGRERILELSAVVVSSLPDRNTVWSWRLSIRDGMETVTDHREERAVENQWSNADIDRLRCPELGFGDFDTPFAMR